MKHIAGRRQRIWPDAGPAFVCAALLVGWPHCLSAQLPAPTAISDFDFVRCAHHTCLWVPSGTHRTFQKGELSYTVEVRDEDESGGTFVLRRDKRELLRTPLQDLSASTSVVWSDDGNNLAVTWSDGGAIGNFHVRAFHIEGDAVTELPVTAQAFKAFKARHWCEARGDNIQAYNWLSESHSLILVLSVYPTGDCGKESGHTEAYVVDATTGDIKENWTLSRLKTHIKTHPEIPMTLPR